MKFGVFMEKPKMPMTAQAAQQLYVAYFNRPADALGLAYWMTKDAAAASTAFASSAEYAATYAGIVPRQHLCPRFTVVI
jgi:hypothetical protein